MFVNFKDIIEKITHILATLKRFGIKFSRFFDGFLGFF